ncbi:hypothetical protein N7486_000496, partial [Penicillium sp. IBT 16267x]
NIITGKRKRAYFTSIASTEDKDAYQRPHRDDLPPKPLNWLEMIRHPHRDAFIEAAALEVKTLEKKGIYQEVFTYKFDSNGLLVKHKARIYVRGDL